MESRLRRSRDVRDLPCILVYAVNKRIYECECIYNYRLRLNTALPTYNTAFKQYSVELQVTALTWTDPIAHLGHILCSSLDDSMDIDKRKRDFCSQANYFFAHFHHLSPALKSGLFQTYCQSFYDSQIWNLQNAAIESFNAAWRKAIRKLWGVPYRTHCNQLHHLMFGKNFINILHSRFITFACSCLSS